MMKKLALITCLLLVSISTFSQSGYYFNDTILEYEPWRKEIQTNDNKLVQSALALYLINSYHDAYAMLDSIPSQDSSVLSLKRNILLGLGDFDRANYFHGQLNKNYKKSNNFRRYFISQFAFQPIITTSNFYDIASPYFGSKFLVGTDVTSKWSMQHEYVGLSQQLSNYHYTQSEYNLHSKYQLNSTYSVSFNYKGVQLKGERFKSKMNTSEDTISASGPIIDFHYTTPEESGIIRRGMNLTNLSIDYQKDRWELGVLFGVKNSNFLDSLRINTRDSVVRKTFLPNGDTLVNSTTINNSQSGTANQFFNNNQQVSFKANYTPRWFNDAIQFESWIDLPFNSSKIGFSPYFKTKLRLTPDTWIGGWIRSYSGLTPIELGGLIVNPGLDQVKLKYGGEINYHKSKRWWVIFNLELQKRKEYYTNESYSTLTLDFKFLYRIYR